MFTIAAIMIGAALVTLLIVAAAKPATFRIERSVSMEAPPARIAGHITDFHRWRDWSPWEKLDPGMQRTYDGAAAGEGASYAWSGNGKAGAGRMRITHAEPQRVAISLDFEKPFRASNVAQFTLTPVGGDTLVTWTMTGPQTLLSKLMHTVIDMDKLVGRDFEAGLQNLKAVCEQDSEHERDSERSSK